MTSEITALAGWFGSNRLLAPTVGQELGRLKWCGVPFAGSMAEVPHIQASSILVNDLHRHVINLARVISIPSGRMALCQRLKRLPFHPDTLARYQHTCRNHNPEEGLCIDLAEAYFVCCWMSRASKAGTVDEFKSGLSTRWKANGGSSVARYHSAIRGLAAFAKCFRRCAFETLDAFAFIDRCEDSKDHGIYCDPPFPGVGRKYLHNAGKNEDAELAWHTQLFDAVERFERTRVVCRFYRHPLIERLYHGWTWRELEGRKQTNEAAAEVLVMNGPSYANQGEPSMFDAEVAGSG